MKEKPLRREAHTNVFPHTANPLHGIKTKTDTIYISTELDSALFTALKTLI